MARIIVQRLVLVAAVMGFWGCDDDSGSIATDSSSSNTDATGDSGSDGFDVTTVDGGDTQAGDTSSADAPEDDVGNSVMCPSAAPELGVSDVCGAAELTCAFGETTCYCVDIESCGDEPRWACVASNPSVEDGCPLEEPESNDTCPQADVFCYYVSAGQLVGYQCSTGIAGGQTWVQSGGFGCIGK